MKSLHLKNWEKILSLLQSNSVHNPWSILLCLRNIFKLVKWYTFFIIIIFSSELILESQFKTCFKIVSQIIFLFVFYKKPMS